MCVCIFMSTRVQIWIFGEKRERERDNKKQITQGDRERRPDKPHFCWLEPEPNARATCVNCAISGSRLPDPTGHLLFMDFHGLVYEHAVLVRLR